MQRRSAGSALWTAGLVVLQAGLFARDLARAGDGAARAQAPDFALASAPWRMSPRELRVLPGIGERLALAIADARRAGDGCPDWEDVPGIGPRTAERVRAWLAAHGLPVELCARDG